MRTRLILSSVIIVLVLWIDQFIKFAVKTNLCLHDKIRVTDWFYILFTENKGMAFGMSFIGTAFLALFRMVAIVCFIILLVKVSKRHFPIGFIVCLSLIIAGAFGNIIDNCLYGLIFTESPVGGMLFSVPAQKVPFGEGYGSFLEGRVVDMFYFPFFTWPDWIPIFGGTVFFGAVFNFADAAISCGSVAMLIFYYKLFGKHDFLSTYKAENATN